MTHSLLIQVREKEVEATREVLDHYRLPRSKRERARLAPELSRLIAEHAAKFAGDQEIVHRLLHEAADQSPEQVDRINDFLQRYLGLVIGVSRALRGMADMLAKSGHPVEGAEALDSLIAERERWREDLPDQLALASGPVRAVLQERIAKALKSPPQATDWRSLCE